MKFSVRPWKRIGGYPTVARNQQFSFTSTVWPLALLTSSNYLLTTKSYGEGMISWSTVQRRYFASAQAKRTYLAMIRPEGARGNEPLYRLNRLTRTVWAEQSRWDQNGNGNSQDSGIGRAKMVGSHHWRRKLDILVKFAWHSTVVRRQSETKETDTDNNVEEVHDLRTVQLLRILGDFVPRTRHCIWFRLYDKCCISRNKRKNCG